MTAAHDRDALTLAARELAVLWRRLVTLHQAHVANDQARTPTTLARIALCRLALTKECDRAGALLDALVTDIDAIAAERMKLPRIGLDPIGDVHEAHAHALAQLASRLVPAARGALEATTAVGVDVSAVCVLADLDLVDRELAESMRAAMADAATIDHALEGARRSEEP